MDKVGILYICTGKYSEFWEGFYHSCEEFFLLDCEKHYFVWTDDESINNRKIKYINPIYKSAELWPFPTLKRFEYFLMAESELKKMDYLLFMNANLVVVKQIMKNDILPQGDQRLFVTIHPGYYDKSPEEYPYDNNTKSSAFIEKGKGKYYFQGAFNGGVTSEYLRMCHTLSERINMDLSNGVIATWHDESHLNRYIFDYSEPYRILQPEYLYPEGSDLPFEKKILMLDKGSRKGFDYYRNTNRGKMPIHKKIRAKLSALISKQKV